MFLSFRGYRRKKAEPPPGTQYTFVVRAVNDGYFFGSVYATNMKFEGVPVKWKVTAPDGTVTEKTVQTGTDGLSEMTVTLGENGERHTLEAIVPANNPEMGPSHSELKATFTATAFEPPTIKLTSRSETATHTSLRWSAAVSGTRPQAYVHYYKKSADRDWRNAGNLGRMPSQFSYTHLDLEPGTSYDFQVFALVDGSRFEPGSNVLTAKT